MGTLLVVDLLLLLGLTLRVTRLVVVDEIGEWWIKDPVDRAMQRWVDRKAEELNWQEICEGCELEPNTVHAHEPFPVPWWWKYRSGLDCPWCVGFWIAVACTVSLLLVGGPGHASEWWRWVAGAFTLNYVAANVGPRLGDKAE